MNFLINWSKIKFKSWSGTHYSLLKSLNKFVLINEFQIKFNFFELLILSLIKIINRISNRSDFRMISIKILQKKARFALKGNTLPTIMFEEYITDNLKNSYLYIDLHSHFLASLFFKNNSLLKFTPLKTNVRIKELNFRLNQSTIFMENCKGIFTMSKWLAQYLNHEFPKYSKKIHFVGGGSNIDPNQITNINKIGKRFLFVGVDWERKNGPLVVDSFNRLSEKYNDIELYIAGPKKPPLFSNSRIIYLGNLTFSQLTHYFNLCDFFVMPSKFEAYGLVFAEALIHGLPIIGKNINAMPEFIDNGKNGILINNDDSLELEKAMKILIDNREKFSNFVTSNQQKYLKEFSWDSVAQRMLEIIRKDFMEKKS